MSKYLPPSFEVTVEQWKNQVRHWAKTTACHPGGDPHPAVLLATAAGLVAAPLPDRTAINDSGFKDIFFLEILPRLVAEHGAHTIGWFSACWYSLTPPHITPGTPEHEAHRREVEAWVDEHGTYEGHRETREGVVLVAANRQTFAVDMAETRRHRHKLPTFGPWRGDVTPLGTQLAGEFHGGRVARGMARALGVPDE
jgi:hypothetical protein